MFEIRESTYQELEQRPGFLDVVAEYADETANPAIGSPTVMFERYRVLDKLGMLRWLCVLKGDECVGFASVMFAKSQHYAFPIASIESFYLRKDYRKGTLGLRLVKRASALAKSEGAPGLVFMAPPGSNYDKLCERLGMTHTHNAWWCKA